MSANAGNVVIAIQAVDEASGVFDKIQTSMGLLGNALIGMGPGFAQLGTVMQGFAAGGPMGAAIAGIAELVKGLQYSVDAGAKAQTSWTDLQSALHLTGPAWDAAKAKINAYVESLRTTTTFSDTQLIDAFQRLITYGMSTAQAMDALKASTELAAAKHIGLTTAATALGKAFQGNSMLLVRYGVETSTVSKELALGTEAIKEMGVNLETGTNPQLAAFGDAMAAAGLALTDAHGKLLSHAEVLKEIETAWKGGAISGDQLSTIVAALGITFQGSKALAMDYGAVLGQVNTQFGGAAQAQASTYAGLQERLGNAVQVVGEKIGNIMLPALSNLLEGMLPIVDSFGKGVSAVQDWITAVGKMPGVKAAVDAAGQAFGGLQKYLSDAWPGIKSVLDGLGAAFDGFLKYLFDTWDSVKNDFGPALDELRKAFGDLNEALKPVWEAFGELMKAFGGSGEGINPLKILLEILVLAIKGLAAVIEVIIPIVKMFAEGFKLAADIIAPPLKIIVEAVSACIKTLTETFQGFYNWLVGHSLWQDLWTAIGTVATNAITGLLASLGAKLFEPMKSAFARATADVESVWSTSWAAVQKIFTAAVTHIQTGLNTKFDEMKSFVTANLGEYAPITNTALTAMQSAMTAITELMKGNWKGFLDNMHAAMDGFWSAIKSATSGALGALESSFAGSMKSLQGSLTGAIAGMQGAWTGFTSFLQTGISGIAGVLSGVQTSLNTTLTTMQHTVTSTISTIQSTLTTALTPAGTVTGGLGPTAPPVTVGANPTPTPPIPPVTPTTVGSTPQSITVPVTVQVSGQVVATQVQKILIQQQTKASQRYL